MDMLKLSVTPLVHLERISRDSGNEVYAKLENLNPTGSHKDRESLAMITDMKNHGFKECVIASTGNAAISLSAMAACEGIKVNVFVSKDISPERLNLITLFEPKLHLVDGTYDDAMLESENYAKQNKLYSANPGHNKNKMLGDSNAGKEIVSQLKPNLPDFLIVPSNNGTLISGIWMGAKMSSANPAMIAAVAEKSALMGSIAGYHRFEAKEFDTTLSESHGRTINITDAETSKATRDLRMEGIFCEPTSAASLAALRILGTEGRIVVLLITGSAFKFAKSYRMALGIKDSSSADLEHDKRP
ncbi:MAG TPA: pyridoxal-phosphate dependent enzyme [Candidatus Bathyarchaeia archaeon]|nr:pyridoxal-phosphate dependent enzyme [Candidatus Bathyarchaeia archaeon]